MHGAVDKSPVGTTETAGSSTQRNLLHTVWQRKWLVVLGVVLGLIVGSTVYSRSRPVYRSTAQVLVIKKRTEGVMPVAGGDLAQSYLEDYVSTHITLLKSPVILEKAAKACNSESELKTFQGQGNPVGVIFAGLAVARDSTGNVSNRTIIELTFQGYYQDETPIILNAVIESYIDFLEGAYGLMSREAEREIKRAGDLLERKVAEQETNYRKFREDTPDLLWRGRDGLNVHQNLVFEIVSKKNALLIQKTDLEARRQAIEAAKKAGKDTIPFLPPITGLKDSNQESQKIDEQLLPLILQKEDLLLDYGKNHPLVMSIERRIERTRQFFNNTTRGLELSDKQQLPVDRYLHNIEQELIQIDFSIETLDKLANAEKDKAKALLKYENDDEIMKERLNRSKLLYKQAIDKLEGINLVREFGGFDAKTIAPPGLGAILATNLLRTLAMSIGLGLLGGVGLAYLADITDRSFRTPEEIRRSLGLTIMGHIPFSASGPKPQEGEVQEKEEGALDSSMCVFYQPVSAEAEAFRSLRTAVFFGTRGSDYKVVQVTSPNMGDGKTTLTCNLAIAIAQSGKRIIIIDADLRRPRIHHIFGLPSRGIGLSDVISGEVPLAEAIHHSPVPGLDVIPAGAKVPNPAEVLTSPEIDRILGELRGEYDYVFVDTPPLLAVTDPCIIAGRVDTILLTIRVSKNGRPAAERAKELLSNISANVMGVIVNGIGGEKGKYGYGYGYGYGYRYYSYYNYGYNYYKQEYKENEEEASQPGENSVIPGGNLTD